MGVPGAPGSEFHEGPRSMNRTTRVALQALAAGTLLAALAFLFVKTAGVDVKNEAQALSLLRQMKDVDSHWDDEVERITDDFSPPTLRSDFGAMMSRMLTELERIPAGGDFRGEIPKLRGGLAEKAQAARAAQDGHERTRAAAAAFLSSLDDLDAPGKSVSPAMAAAVKQLRQDAHRRLANFP